MSGKTKYLFLIDLNKDIRRLLESTLEILMSKKKTC